MHQSPHPTPYHLACGNVVKARDVIANDRHDVGVAGVLRQLPCGHCSITAICHEVNCKQMGASEATIHESEALGLPWGLLAMPVAVFLWMDTRRSVE